MYHRLPQGQERPERSEGQGKDEDSGCAKEEAIHKDGPNKDKGAGALHKSAFATARSATGMDKRGSSHSSVTSDQEDERKGCRTARSREPRKEIYRSRDVVFTTLHFLPRPEGQQCRPTASIFPRLVTEQQAHSKVLAETRKVSVDVSLDTVITTNNSKWSSLLLSHFFFCVTEYNNNTVVFQRLNGKQQKTFVGPQPLRRLNVYSTMTNTAESAVEGFQFKRQN